MRIGRLGLIACAAGIIAGGARADVFEVGTNGVMVRSGHGGAIAALASDADMAIEETAESEALEVALPAAALTVSAGLQAPDAYRSALLDAARRYDVSPDLLAALVWRESRWQPAAVSIKGAIGLGQLMPATARALAVNPHDAGGNLMGAARYLRQMLDLFDGDVERALAAYNAGPARVLRAGGVPPIAETRTYVSAIIDRLAPRAPAARTGAIQ